MSHLKGLTWNHDRGLAPLLDTARVFAEWHPGTIIEWQVRSLQQFGDAPISALAEAYDLLVIDHPFVGEVSRDRCLLPLDEYVPETFLKALENESVGASHQSYRYDGHQWAFAIDAAAQVAGYRPDLFEAEGIRLPETWDEVFEIASLHRGFVTAALSPLDALLCFFTLCANTGHPPFADTSGGYVVDHHAGEVALMRLRTLANNSARGARAANPISIWERMSTTEEIGYCPLAFGYSNYARDGYRRSLLSFANIPSSGHGCAGATLGGAGLAISARCRNIEIAVQYASWVASADCQRTVYIQSGGQPGNRRAWTDADANAITSGFFQRTLLTIEQAFLRPRFPGFPAFQTAAWEVISNFLTSSQPAECALTALDQLYKNALDSSLAGQNG